ncbi:MAG: hypothetical protein U9N50_07825 [Pseudomonadota bacterium]|nr:hypothetical protein [Pseudomonadota bacterium]
MAQATEWTAVTGADKLRHFMSGQTIERSLPDGETSRAEYKADGTGVLYSWGASFQRTWSIKGEDQICLTEQRKTLCYQIEKSSADANLYRVIDVATGRKAEFRAKDAQHSISAGEAKDIGNEGSAATPSAAEIAAELANPNTAMGTINTNFDFISYDGDLPGASNETAFKVTLQPGLPYPLGGGTNFFFRPAIPIIFSQPIPTPSGSFDTRDVELGDIGFDSSFGFSFKTDGGSNVLIAGLAGTLPTASDDAIGLDQWLLGPELGGFVVRKWGVAGIIASQQWDVAGEDSFSTSVSGGQYIYTINLKDGWQITGSPVWSYNHKADSDDAWTFPLGGGIARTVIVKGRPWKLSMQYWNFIESPDAFGPKHQIRFTIGPVVKLPWKGRQ